MEMTKVEFANSFDAKIMKWDRKDFEELVASMTDEEINAMADILKDGFGIADKFQLGLGIDLFYCDSRDFPIEVVYNYIKRWLYAQIEEGIQLGTKELFEIATAI